MDEASPDQPWMAITARFGVFDVENVFNTIY
jgi:hypothetical protein